MAIKLFDSELKVMSVLWNEGDMTAKQISDILAFYESIEGQREFAEWKKQREAEQEK